jgi:hypothetical protein
MFGPLGPTALEMVAAMSSIFAASDKWNELVYILDFYRLEVNFTNLLAQSANAPVVTLWRQVPFSFTNKITPNFTFMHN